MVMERARPGITIDTGPYPGISDGSAVGLSRGGGVGNRGEPDPGDRIRGEISRRRCVLRLFGADVSVHGDTAIIKEDIRFFPGVVETPDLRGGAALSSQLCRQTDSAWSRTGDT